VDYVYVQQLPIGGTVKNSSFEAAYIFLLCTEDWHSNFFSLRLELVPVLCKVIWKNLRIIIICHVYH
jgi:hypothetical protein